MSQHPKCYFCVCISVAMWALCTSNGDVPFIHSAQTEQVQHCMLELAMPRSVREDFISCFVRNQLPGSHHIRCLPLPCLVFPSQGLPFLTPADYLSPSVLLLSDLALITSFLLWSFLASSRCHHVPPSVSPLYALPLQVIIVWQMHAKKPYKIGRY